MVITLAAGLWAWRINVAHHAQNRSIRFDVEREQLRSAISNRLSQYVDRLRAARGFFLGSNEVDRDEWHAFIEGLSTDNRFTDIHTIGYAPRLTSDQLPAYIDHRKTDDYRIHPSSSGSIHAPVAFAVNAAHDNGLVGFDLMTHPAIADALRDARSTGKLAVTEHLTGLPGHEDHPVVAMVMPVAREPGAAPALDGWVVSMIHLDQLIDAIRLESMSTLAVTLVDTRHDQVLYRYPDDQSTASSYNASLHAQADLPMVHDRWQLQLSTTPWSITDARQRESGYVLITVVAISLMLYVVLTAIGRTRSAAIDLAHKMTGALRSSEAEARVLATTDQLTSLPNRAQLIVDLQRTIDRTAQDGTYAFAVLFLDLDRFKFVNDSLGHHVGDKLLIEVANRLQQCLRTSDPQARPGSEDIVARLGGDEFIILLDAIHDVTDATHIAGRIIHEVSAPYHLDGHDICTSVSIGITASDFAYQHPEDVLRDADAAMYQAKHAGKARHTVFDRSMHKAAVNRLRLESDLRQAVREQQFVLRYQPIIEAHSGRLHGFEALVRWNHPQRGLIAPDEFLEIAEETGHVRQLGDWVLRQSCQQLRQWRHAMPEAQHLRISINLSRVQLLHPDIVSDIQRIVRDNGLAPDRVRLEIAENVVMRKPDACIMTLDKLRRAGFELMMDDFGTGYSSLSLLHRLPFHGIKLDHSLISAMNSRDHIAVVQTIVALAQNLDMHVTAEGVETRDQATQLLDLSCDLLQGYLIARPQTPQEAEPFIRRMNVTDPDLQIVA
jgi:diguanylate cyclase (GGDEF)-like protein